MFIISNKEMIVAAANAGILGAMPSLNARTPEQFEADLLWIKERTERPYAINLTIGLTDPERLKKDVELVLKHEVPVLITSYGNPGPIVEKAHEQGAVVLHDVVRLDHAKKAESVGVDAIIGVSQGAGGHAGEINPYVLIPHLRDNLNIPVVAAGCISRGSQMAAAFSLGAELAYIGTRFIASEECGAPPPYKELVVGSSHRDIVYTNEVTGVNASFIKSTLPKEGDNDRKRWKDVWSAGQGVSQIHDVLPISKIVENLVTEYHAAKAAMP